MTDAPAPRPSLDRDRLAALAPGWRVEVHEEAGSTNALAAEQARAGAPAGLVVVAEHQTAGRGRLDRTWETPARAALTWSVLLRPDAPAERWPWLPLLAGLAVVDALAGAGVGAGLKWPNDVLLAEAGEERKAAGLLLERVDTPSGPAAVLGAGLNVTTTRTELPVPGATSVALAAGTAPDRTDLLVALLAALRDRYDAWERGEAAALRASYRAACRTLGRRVRVDLPGGTGLAGTATDVDDGGRLLVDGTPVAAGDVVHVRSDPDPGGA